MFNSSISIEFKPVADILFILLLYIIFYRICLDDKYFIIHKFLSSNLLMAANLFKHIQILWCVLRLDVLWRISTCCCCPFIGTVEPADDLSGGYLGSVLMALENRGCRSKIQD